MCSRQREIGVVDCERGRSPAWICGMTCLTIGSNTYRRMGWICCGIIIRLVAADACIGGISVISVVTIVATWHRGVRPCKWIIIIMLSESSRSPAGIGGVTCLTIGSYADRRMRGIVGAIIISLVTSYTGIRNICIVPIMT